MLRMKLMGWLNLLSVGYIFSQTAYQNARPASKAVVVGVSHYQHADIPDLWLAHRDAEAFAAFLLSPGGGSLAQEDVLLLTNEQATGARFAAALDWAFEQPVRDDEKIIIYFAGYGEVSPGSGRFPAYFLMNDSPLSPLSAGAFNFPVFFQAYAKDLKRHFTIVTNIYPLVLPPDMAVDGTLQHDRSGEKRLKPDAVKNIVPTGIFATPFEEISRAKISLNHLLLDGLLGLADNNADREVTLRELSAFLKKHQAATETWPGQLTIVADDKSRVLSFVDEKLLLQLSEHRDGMFPSIIHLEATPTEDRLLQSAPQSARQHYQDFVIALKLGHLLEPPDRCAANLYDTLVQEESLKPLHSSLRRRLAAALQDEVQQALNGYLQTDIREIVRRNKDSRYALYPKYLSLAIQLLGERHVMRSILLAKQHYFEGLRMRLEGENAHDTAAFWLALKQQQLALTYEPEAAFVVNEIGVIYDRLKHPDEALEYFQSAADLAPNWSLPQSNLCYAFGLAGDYENALEHGKQAIRLSPRNVLAFNQIGILFSKTGKEADAEKTFVRATFLDPSHPESFYNLSCLKAKHGDYRVAFEWLEQALQKGFDDRDALYAEKDWASARQLPRFDWLVEKYGLKK